MQGWSAVVASPTAVHPDNEAEGGPLGSADSGAGAADTSGAYGGVGVLLPPSVIAAFLEQQRGSTEGDDDGSDTEEEAAAAAAAAAAAGYAAGQRHPQPSRAAGPRTRRPLPRWLKRAFSVAAHTSLLVGGVAIGRAIHANYMATLDDRDALASRADALARQVDKAGARAAAAEASLVQERDAAAARARELGAALEGANARVAQLTGEAAEVGRLNLALQRRLEKAEARADKAAEGAAETAAKLAAARGERDAASERAARSEKDAAAALDRLRQAEGRAAALDKANAGLRAERDAAKHHTS
ncbi:MAG: hypothetical protein J3K34DRAFT_159685 [Monoraphidium minutum]|nr:MAG: hypothetical protein J3K34DRAFT_159685 [Monoraphidium minutum]